MPKPFAPRELFSQAVGAARVSLDVYSWTGKRIVDTLRQGLDSLDGRTSEMPDDSDAESAGEQPTPPTQTQATANPLGGKLHDLLDRSLDQSTRESRAELFHRLLDQLVADEARILGALSDGSSSPMVNVYSWGQSRRAVLENASLVGRSANVALPEMVPHYVSHLLALGLVEAKPEDPRLETEYELLMAETAVLAAVKNGGRGPIPAKVEKMAVAISPLGSEFWAAATGESPDA
ncbi:Abi-alpha family protein [Mycobacterium sp. NPDC006124]|uniref:Abi-alpha family protein n=1 Tax=Mycobacterium sp. NPDC006124 TaxID=3156729 RepID=UPI0033A6E5CB